VNALPPWRTDSVTALEGPPSAAVLHEFGVREGVLTPLGPGSWRVGQAFLKRSVDLLMAEWACTVLSAIPQRGFRIPRPISARHGRRWVVDGWTASEWIDGRHDSPTRWEQTFAASHAFHEALQDVSRPPFIDAKQTWWSRADHVAWGDAEPPDCAEPMRTAIARLLDMRRPIRQRDQAMHGDLTGNVLFAEGEDPAIIDFAPYYRPARWADAIVVVDALAWGNADETILRLVSGVPDLNQLLVRALLFRSCTVAFRWPAVEERLIAELGANQRAMRVVESGLGLGGTSWLAV
jgi:uncharacterized protein (TIGR02569 family)